MQHVRNLFVRINPKKLLLAGVTAVAFSLSAAGGSARADYWTRVPYTYYVTYYDSCGCPYQVPYTAYRWVYVRTYCN
jgi:hypothetical protein